jgi:hypothetical protein
MMRASVSGVRWPAAAARALLLTMVAAGSPSAFAQVTLPPITVGAGLRTSFTDTRFADDAQQDTSDFDLGSARIYLSGTVTDDVKVMFNTEYNGTDETVKVIDAAAMFSRGDRLNIWAGRAQLDFWDAEAGYYLNGWLVFARWLSVPATRGERKGAAPGQVRRDYVRPHEWQCEAADERGRRQLSHQDLQRAGHDVFHRPGFRCGDGGAAAGWGGGAVAVVIRSRNVRNGG